MKKLLGDRLVYTLAVLGFVGLLVGCESDVKTEGVSTYFNENPATIEPAPVDEAVPMRMTPDEAVVNADGERLAIRIEGGTPPYHWTVENTRRGRLIAVASKEVVYQRVSSGDNLVFCTDSLGQRVLALITQP